MINEERYYKLDEEVNVDEDEKHEFKNHISFTSDNISSMTKKLQLMKPISQSINAFLNNGVGGMIYLGIDDNGSVRGLSLTEYQRDHVQLSLDELLKRYQPAVPRSWINLEFVRVARTDKEFKEEQLLEKNSIVEGRLKPHCLGHVCCWCYINAKERIKDLKEYIPSFVVEITIEPWDPNNSDNENIVTTKTRLHPIFEDEQGDVWMRRFGGNRKYSKEEVFEMTIKEVEEYHRAKQ